MRLFPRRREATKAPAHAPDPGSAGSRTARPAVPSTTLVVPTHHPVRLVLVRSATQVPVADCEVRILGHAEFPRSDAPRAVASATTGPDGVVRFLLPPGAYALSLADHGHETRRRLDVTGRADHRIELDGAPPATRRLLRVAVRRAGAPVAGEDVRVVAAGVPGARVARTGADGACAFLLPPGSYRLTCDGEETTVRHAEAETIVFALAPAPVEPLPDEAWVPTGVRIAEEFGVAGPARSEPRLREAYEPRRATGTATFRVAVTASIGSSASQGS